MVTGDVRRDTPALIAVSSFGEGLPRVTPLTAPGEAPLTPTRCHWQRVARPASLSFRGESSDGRLSAGALSGGNRREHHREA
jgi:hypothetical protein